MSDDASPSEPKIEADGDKTLEPQLDERGFLASTGFLLARIGSESRRRWNAMLAAHGLAQHTFGVLMVLGQLGAASQREISAAIGIDPRNSVAVLDALERNGLVERRPDPHDRRRNVVDLTPEGRALLDRLRVDGAETERAMLEGLTASERADLHRLLAKLLGALVEQSGEKG